MFTGIIQETGTVVGFLPKGEGSVLQVRADQVARDAAPGDSIAVNGCCLTVVRNEGNQLEFDVLAETARLTNLASLRPGDPVNLESSLRFGGKMGGHFVTGHIDGLGTIVRLEPKGADHHLVIDGPAGSGRLVIPKGSLAIDGISLTVAAVAGDRFEFWLIPHTVAVTNLAGRRAGDRVNLEFDLLGKYVEKLRQAETSPSDS